MKSLCQPHIHTGANYRSFLPFIKQLPKAFTHQEGQLLYKGRNELRLLHYQGVELVVKSFQIPNWVNRIAYGLFRSSKAQRSFEYAERLLQLGIGTPEPVGYYTERKGLFFHHSYYVSRRSICPYTFADLLLQPFAEEEAILQAIARTTAQLHEQGLLHKDYSRGNILFALTKQGVKVEIIDLNRIRFKQIGWEEGCRNFERLPLTDRMLTTLTKAYAQARGFDEGQCLRWMQAHHTNRI